MTTEKNRIPLSENTPKPRSVRPSTSNIAELNISEPFPTIEEYIEHCLKIQKIRAAKVEGENILISGNFEIDGAIVLPNLDWSCVIADSAKISNNAITKYHHLPITKMGVSTNIPIPSSEDFLKHNAHSRYKKEDDKFVVDEVLRIPHMDKPIDLSSIYVDGNIFWYHKNDIKFEHLPTAKSFYGIDPKTIKVSNYKKIESKAKAKGLGSNICKEISKPNKIKSMFSIFSNEK